ncbi:MAG: fused MFS/spermidine synthase [Planctomycetes bacterium]|nr:fused MFS/spermidine synthase [Planctomycetota bacterium]
MADAPALASRSRDATWTSFLAAAAATALQVLVPRLLAPSVGTNLVPATATVAVVLLGTALGNAWGGRIARRDVRRRLAAALAVAGLAMAACGAVLPAVAEAVAGLATTPRLLALLAVVLPCATALGAVGPLAASVATADRARPGRALGLVVAAGALGSLVGVYGAGFGLVPHVAVSRALVGAGAGLAAVGATAWVVRLRGAAGAPDAADGAPPAASTPAPIAPRAPDLAPARAGAVLAAVGAATLVVEVVAARTANRLVGGGLHAWTAVLGAVLAGLVLGAFVGGRLADRGDARRTLARVLLGAAALVLLAAWSPALLAAAAQAPGADRPLRIALGAAAAWLLPCAALGAVPPLAVRAALAGRDDGATIGRLYALQTAGCVVAAVATGPLLLPALGATGPLVATALGLVLLPALLGERVERPFAVALVLATAAASLPLDVARRVGTTLGLRADGGPDVVLVRESAYQQVRVDVPAEYASLARPRLRRLVLDGFVHGYADLDDPSWLGYGYEGLFLAATERALPPGRPPRAFFVGGGACTFPRVLAARARGAEIDVAEIDAVVTEVAVEAMGLPADAPFRVHAADARAFLRDRPRAAPRYDLVYGDAFSDVSVPWPLVTREFVALLRRHLAPDGVYLANVVDAPGGDRFLGAVVATLREAFRRVEVLGLGEPSAGRETFVLVATDRETLALEGLVRPDPAKPGGTLPVRRFTAGEVDGVVARAPRADGAPPAPRLLTDDHAPVEWLLAPVAGRSGR